MIAAARAGYRPIGVDVKLEPLQAARRVMKAHRVTGDVVVADISALPFKNEVFECVFSYSVIQHLHKRKAAACIVEAERVLRADGTCLIELPLKHGLTNFRHFVGRRKQRKHREDDFESWAVRYYSWRQLNRLFNTIFSNTQISTDCFCGIGVRPEDIDLLPWKYKPIVIVSEILKHCTHVFPPLAKVSDSVFIHARKRRMTEA
jgi:SAM-dependent methyltransferase